MCYTVGTQRRCLCVNGWTGDRCRNPPGGKKKKSFALSKITRRILLFLLLFFNNVSDVEVTNTDMRPELLELVQDIVTSEIIASADIKDSAKQVKFP